MVLVKKNVKSSLWDGEPERSQLYDRRRELIIRTAARIFANKGYENSSIDDVAEALDVSKPTIYYYLKSKENLLVEIMLWAVKRFDDAVASHEGENGLELVKAFMHEYAAALFDDMARCMVWNMSHVARSPAGKQVRAAQRQIHQRLHQAVLLGIKDGSIIAADPFIVTQMIFGAYNTIPLWYKAEGRLKPDEIQEIMIDVLRKGIEVPAAARRQSRRKRRSPSV